MNLMNCIYRRHSVRKYKNEKLSTNTLNEIEALANSSLKLYRDISMYAHLVKDGMKIQKISKGIIGSYGKIVAPHYIVITSEEKEGYLENVGFALERLVLQLTGMNIGSCWIGGFIKKDLLNDIINIPQNQIPVIVISFGYPETEDALTNIISSDYKRKAIKGFCSGDFNDEWIGIMKAVGRAPSAMNSQPWRFFKSRDAVDLYTVKRTIITRHLEMMNRIDAGIALCHMHAALEDRNIEFKILKLADKDRKDLNYITSISLDY
ncbi:hypothetical protein GOM49_15285 [Clostridium bovifaecis]|uniref:Putative nitroreductase TM1586 domain-containing protein n=1 Tax=Clostridium bovifaecis TaxID=2184719 RepID=A0A6I6F4Z8_9CLOT|nr:hypothetical protein GOM49_15285 [Clostridium bovifaecis]